MWQIRLSSCSGGSRMSDLKGFTGKREITVAEAMNQIDKNACGILFITDDDGKLVGCITDGDIRRYLLGGGQMTGNVMDAANKSPRVAHTMEEARVLYHKKNFVVIPVLDENGVVVDLYKGDSSNFKKPHNPIGIPVVINAGGKGTRLDPFTRVLPKPLIPVGELPIIEHIMQEYQTYDCNKFHIIVNYKKDLIKAFFADAGGNYDISWYDETVPLGTGGGLSLLKGAINETFFFSNCDILLKANYESIYKFHKENGNAVTMVCAHKNLSIPYGVVEMGENGILQSMKEKPLMSFLTNTGVYVVEPDVLDDIEDGVPAGFPDIIEKARSKGKRIAVFPVSENDWMDMGQISELEKMRIRLDGE